MPRRRPLVIDPMSVLVATPTLDGKTEVTYNMGLTMLIAHRKIGMPIWLAGCSDIGLARNKLVRRFLEHPEFEHLVFIDADIGFSEADFDMLMEGDEEAVCAEYRKKDQTRKIRVPWGLGFARISRRVFEAIDALQGDNGADIAQRFRMDGEEWRDYFPAGVVVGVRRGEDHNFWLLAQLTGLPIRLERRTALVHTGPAHWRYRAEDFTGPPENAFADSDDGPPAELPDATEI